MWLEMTAGRLLAGRDAAGPSRGAEVALCQGDISSFVGLHVVNRFFTHSLPGFFPFLIVCSYICRPWRVELTAARIPPC